MSDQENEPTHEQIFGRDSDEELSEDERPQKVQRRTSGSASPQGGSDKGGDRDSGDQDAQDAEEDQDGSGLPSFRKKLESGDGDEGDSQDRLPKKKKKKKRHGSEDGGERGVSEDADEQEEEVPVMSEKELKRARIAAMIDEAAKGGKKKAPRKKAGEDDLDVLADEEVAALRRDMVVAADEDEEANRLKKPAVAKLKLLPKVVNTLQKNHLQQSILDNNLLDGVKRWLEPLPDKSLPALNIQHQFFAILEKMTIDTISLKMSGLGKVVVFYSMCNRVEPSIKRSAEHLIEIWSRPILKRSSSYRDRHVQAAEWNPDMANSSQVTVSASPGDGNNRRNVSIPQAVTSGFRIAPKSSVGANKSDSSHEARLANHHRLNRFKSRLKDAKR